MLFFVRFWLFLTFLPFYNKGQIVNWSIHLNVTFY